MSEKPIIFSSPMVRAILDGTKTQTRRIIKPQLSKAAEALCRGMIWRCPYGPPGTRLWVRESFVIESSYNADEDYPPPHDDGRPILHKEQADYGAWWEQPHYRATDPTPELWYPDREEPHCRWKPSIHMPRWASRIELLIKRVWVERLQNISEADALAEGVRELPWQEGQEGAWWSGGIAQGRALHGRTPVGAYSLLWQQIHGLEGWLKNPWVWCIEFERIKP